MGRNRVMLWPAAAPMPAMDEPALPVEARVMSGMLNLFAAAETRNEARSLKDAVGLEPSSLMNRCLNPELRLRFSGSDRGGVSHGYRREINRFHRQHVNGGKRHV